MTTITSDRSNCLAAPIGNTARNLITTAMRWLQDDVSRLHSAVRERYRKRKAAAALRGMNDMFLRDIGMHRSEVNSVVMGLPHDRTRRPRG